MRKIFKLFIVPFVALSMTACSEDDFTESIFGEATAAVDTTATTAPFDQWVYDNFTVPYNVAIDYKFNLPASDLDFQLTPAEYKRSQLLSHFILYLFYDVYTKYGGEDFMKQYGPRIFHYIGSSGYSPTTGTEVLGTASGGVKITLYKINEMKAYSEDMEYTASDVDQLNDDYFHTMHHEFSHILHQTKSYPVTFGQVTSGTYDPMDWQERDSTTAHRLGYVTNYASSANYEDFVETLSCIITDTDYRWMTRIIDACLAGVKSGDKESILTFITDNLQIKNFDASDKIWNNFTIYEESEYDENEGTYVATGNYALDVHRDLTSTVYNGSSYVSQYRYSNPTSFTSFRTFLNDWVPVLTSEDTAGMNAILRKIDIANTWYNEKWGLDIYEIRQEVSSRQEAINDFLKTVTIYDYQ
ncbi:MAG: putative zinc-binding metallopeptidase [Prevotellaceae bacterium]|nr:putative zinc-binding metallopeptidase [Prevotellaceae bacterium]